MEVKNQQNLAAVGSCATSNASRTQLGLLGPSVYYAMIQSVGIGASKRRESVCVGINNILSSEGYLTTNKVANPQRKSYNQINVIELLEVISESENDCGPLRITLAEYMSIARILETALASAGYCKAVAPV